MNISKIIKMIFIFLLIIINLVVKAYSSEAKYQSKSYLERWIETPLYRDNFGNPSPQKRRLYISLTGPKEIKRGLVDRFILNIIPEHCNLKYSDPRAEIIRSFDISIVSSEGFIELFDGPLYKVRLKDEPEFKTVYDDPTSDRKLYEFMAEALHSFLYIIPIVGQLMTLNDALLVTKSWLEIKEPDWMSIWEYTYRYNTYPIIRPNQSIPTGLDIWARQYKIEIPFCVIGETGNLFLYINHISVTNTLDIGDLSKGSVFSAQKYTLMENLPLPNNANPITLRNFYTSDTKIEVNPNIILRNKVDIIGNNNKYKISISVSPEVKNDLFVHLNKINLALEFKKNIGKISGFPNYYNYARIRIPYISLRKELRDDVLANWFKVVVSIMVSLVKNMGSQGGYLNSSEYTVTEGIVYSADLVEAYSKAINTLSFSDNLKLLWDRENTVNFYQLPPFINKSMDNDGNFEGLRGFKIDIPIELYKEPLDGINIYIKIDDIHYGVPELRAKGNLITSTTALHDHVSIVYKIPIECYYSESGSKRVLGFILDSSGSMSSNDPDDIRKTAMKLILNQLNNEDVVFIIDFDSDAILLNSSQWKNWTKDSLSILIDRIDSNGGTNIGSGLKELQKVLLDNNIQWENAGVLLLTDGLGDYDNQAAWYAEQGLPIYTVGLVGDNNASLLNQISSETNGKYFKARSAEDIFARFQDFYHSLTGGNRIFSSNTTIFANQKQEGVFYIDSSIKSFNVYLQYEGSTVDLELISPSGRLFNKNNYDGWIIGKVTNFAAIYNPEKGKWVYRLIGTEVPDVGENVRFEVNALTEQTFKIEISGEKSIISGKKIHFHIALPEPFEKYSNVVQNCFILTPKLDTLKALHLKNTEFEFNTTHDSGNYEIHYFFKGIDENNETLWRELSENIYIGEMKPGNIGQVIDVISNKKYIIGDLGLEHGNRIAIKFYLHKRNEKDWYAYGYIINVKTRICYMRVNYIKSGYNISSGDIIELDKTFWAGD